jgi:hypothetical protein
MGFQLDVANGLEYQLERHTSRIPALFRLLVRVDDCPAFCFSHHNLYTPHTPEEDDADKFCANRE